MSKDKDKNPRQEESLQNERRRRQAEELIARALEERRRFRLAQALKEADLPQPATRRESRDGEGEWTFAVDKDD